MKVGIFQFGPFELDPGRLELRKRGVRIRLPVSRIRLLLLLVMRRGDLVTRDEIAECLWKDEQNVEIVGGINTAVNHLRSRLGDDAASPRYIETVIGVGYRFVSGVVEITSPEMPGTEPLLESPPAETSPAPEAPAIAATPRNSIKAVAVAAAVLVLGAPVAYYLSQASVFHRNVPQSNVGLARVTDSGDIQFADLSPDGNYLAFVRDQGGSQSLFLKQLASGEVTQLATVGEDECPGLAFSPDGNYVYFARRKPQQPGGELYRMSFLGGNPTRLISSGVSGPPAISPDGRRVAFVRSSLATHGQDSVVAALLDGSGERVLASYDAPGIHLNRVSWTADGKSLVYPLQSGLMIIPAEGGTAHRVPGTEWAEIDDVRQMPQSRDLIVLGRLPGSNTTQIFEMSLAQGELRQITHDLSNYTEVRVAADGKALLALEDLVLSSIQIVAPGHGSEKRPLRQENQNLDGYSGLAWTPEGNIVYISESDRGWDVMEVDGNGAKSRRLAEGEPPTPYTDPVISPRGDFIAVSQWNGNDVSNIWRMDRNGGSMKRLTSGKQDIDPSVMPDGQWVVYSSVQGNQAVLMKVPSQGGPVIRVTDYNAGNPAISPDGKWIACFRTPQSGQPSSLSIVASEGGPPTSTFPLPATALYSALEWTPDGRAVGFINQENGVGNIWQQPVAGGPLEPVTHFASGRIFKFRWSRDGRLALSGGTETSDAILIRNFRESAR